MNARQIVNRFIPLLLQSAKRHYILEGEQAHPLLLRELRKLAGMTPGEDQGKIRVDVEGGSFWAIMMDFYPDGSVELKALPEQMSYHSSV
ncbi:hypothetical protein JXA32_06105 [Candidatus Sumerlaeota bacterium]|nr:hypothetical protein [Candidatus Sumerlaeota bacterium]